MHHAPRGRASARDRRPGACILVAMPAPLRLLRPLHWTKNLVVLAPALFAGQLTDADALARALSAFGIFCLLASAIYALNDVSDAPWDRAHPAKRARPVASGAVTPRVALLVAALLAAAGLAWAAWLEPAERTALGVLPGVSVYLALNLAYTKVLKRIPFVDLACLATGLVLRALVGSSALSLVPSDWLVICCFSLALFLAAGKRRLELARLGLDGARAARPLVAHHPRGALDAVLVATAVATCAAYVAYTLSPVTAAKMGGRGLVATVPFVVFCVVRYARLVLDEAGDDPVRLLVSDRGFVAAGLLWTATAAAVVYGPW